MADETPDTHPPMQGSTVDYCERWPDEGHSWVWTKHAGLPVVSTRECPGCNYLDVSEVQARLAAAEKVVEAAEAIAKILRVLLEVGGPVTPVSRELLAAVDAYRTHEPEPEQT